MERRPMKVWATPQSIDRMDECFGWLFWLEPDAARVVWMRAEGMRWKPICRRLGVSRATAWRWWAAALIAISHRLKADDKARMPKPRKLAS
jgi:predicted DNA-binding transcriptional regulator AlpA